MKELLSFRSAGATLPKVPLNASVNAFLIKYEEKLVLIDAGSSELVGPTAGKLPQFPQSDGGAA